MKVPINLREHVAARAAGCCEYCLIHESDTLFDHQVDHIISIKHGGETVESNLAFACLPCNRFKGSDLGSIAPNGLLVRFFDPRNQRWSEHFQLEGPVIEPISAHGEVTARLFRLNTTWRVRERQRLQQLSRYPKSR